LSHKDYIYVNMNGFDIFVKNLYNYIFV